MRNSRLMILGWAAALAVSGAPICVANRQPASPPRSPLVTLDYVNAEVTDVIRALAAQSRANVALNPSVKGQVTVQLREKTVDEAMQVIANAAGLGAKRVNDTYVIAPRSEMRQTLERLGATREVVLTYLDPKAAADLAQGAFPDLTARPQGKAVALIGANEDLDAAERLLKQNDTFDAGSIRTTERLPVKHRPAKDAAASLAKMVPGIHAEPAGDGVVLTGTKTQVETARQGLHLIDVEGRPDVEARVYNIRYASAPELIALLKGAVPDVEALPGPESYTPAKPALNILSGQFVGASSGSAGSSGSGLTGAAGTAGGLSGGAGPVGGTTTTISKNALTLLLKGSPEAVEEAMKVLAKVDTAPRQMVIEAKVVETSPELAEEYGLKWKWTRFGFYEARPGTSVSTGTTGGPGGDFTEFLTRPLGFGAFSRVPWSFQSVLSAMVTKREAKILANPQIAVLDNQDASIFIGDTLRFQSLAQSSPTTGNQFTVVEVPVGIILLVHPRVNDDQNITLRVHPVVSTVTGFVEGLPQTSAREAETIVRVKDGDTLVIGGLIRDEDIKTMSKIPLLGDLPLVGHLFRHRERNHRRTEVMVFLTIRLIN